MVLEMCNFLISSDYFQGFQGSPRELLTGWLSCHRAVDHSLLKKLCTHLNNMCTFLLPTLHPLGFPWQICADGVFIYKNVQMLDLLGLKLRPCVNDGLAKVPVEQVCIRLFMLYIILKYHFEKP